MNLKYGLWPTRTDRLNWVELSYEYINPADRKLAGIMMATREPELICKDTVSNDNKGDIRTSIQTPADINTAGWYCKKQTI